MKSIWIGFIFLFTQNLHAQDMITAEQTVIQLFVATDNQDWETVEQSFSEEVVLDYSSMNGNPAASLTPQQITTAWKAILPGFQATHHQLGNFISQIEGNKATVSCYGTASHFLPDEGGNLWLVVGSYDFALIKDAGDTWKISSMKFNFTYQDGNTALPEKAMKNIKQ